MNLSDLGLNRYLYKDGQQTTSENAISSSEAQNNYVGTPGNNGASTQSNGLQPGSNPVQGTLIQSSASNDRVEINPSDNFFAYNDGNIVVTINKDGITGSSAVIANGEFDDLLVNNLATIENLIVNDTVTTEDLIVNDTFTYQGIPQPLVYWGIVTSGGGGVLPTGWTATNPSTGVYLITHNLNRADYGIVCTPSSGHYRAQITNHNVNDITIDFQQTNYVTTSFPVSGGGGGSVSVSGVRDTGTPEVPVNSGFEFVLAVNP